MKKIYTVAALLFASLTTNAQNVGIGTASPNPSAKLEIVDINRGILLPRVALTATNIAAPVATPATWLVVFNTATAGAGATAVSPGLYYWDGTQWVRFQAGNAATDWTLLGNASTNAATNFIGTTDAVDFVTRTSNAERMRVTSAGNMGLGTNNPSARLHVAGGAIRPEAGNVSAAGINWGLDVFGGGGDEPSIRYYTEGGENTKLLIANQNDADDDITMEAGFLLFRTGDASGTPDADRMIITTAGNVGINTNTPAERLEVVGNVRTSSLAGVGNRVVSSDANGTLTNIATGTNGQVLTLVAGNPTWAAVATTNWTLLGNTGTNAANNFVGTTDAVDFVTRTNNTERMRVTNAGNIGMGTNNPLARLHVAGGAIRPEAGNISAAGINWGLDVFGGGGDEPYIRYYTEGGENTKLLIANQNDADDDVTMEAGFLLFRTGDGGTTVADADRMIITTGGNVGVNTNTPNTIFQVNAGTNTANLNPAAISINRAAANVEGSIWFMTGGAARWILQQDNDNTENLQLWSTATGSFIQTWNHTTGNIGVRNTAPSVPLDVNGTIAARDVTGAGGQNILIGDDAFLSDVDAAHRMAIISSSNTAIGELQLGFTGTNPILSGTSGFLNISQPVQVQNTANRFYRGVTPQAFSDQFDNGGGGVYISNNEGEEGGFWSNGNYSAIISPGDNDLVKFIDEDLFNNAGSVFDNNAMRARIDGGGQYFQISDAKTKENIVPINNSLQKIMAISGYTYQFKLAPEEVKKGQKPLQAAGVMAQEVEKVLPEAVSNHNGDYMVNYAAFAPLFIEAFKEQQQQIELLKQQNTMLEQRLKSLEEKK